MMSILQLGVETMPPLLMAARFLVAGTILFPISLFSRSSPGAPESAPSLVARRKLLAPQSRRERAPSARGGKSLTVQPDRNRCPLSHVSPLSPHVTHAPPATLAALLIATVPLWLLGIDAGLNHARLGLAPLAYLIVIGSIVAFSAYGIANRLLPTATVATYAYVNPVIAVLLGTLILGENLTTMMIVGGVLIVGAVVLVVRRTPPSH